MLQGRLPVSVSQEAARFWLAFGAARSRRVQFGRSIVLAAEFGFPSRAASSAGYPTRGVMPGGTKGSSINHVTLLEGLDKCYGPPRGGAGGLTQGSRGVKSVKF